MPVKPEVWTLSRLYWERSQKRDGSWAYHPESPASSASMTCAGVSSLIICGMRRFQGQEFLQGDEIKNCGKGTSNRQPQGRDRLAGPQLPGRREFRRRPAVEVLLPLWPRARRPAGGHPLLRHARLVSPGRRGAGGETGQARRVLAGRPDGAQRPAHPRDQLRRAVPGQGPRPGADQQAPPLADRTTGTTTPTTCATSSTWSPATGRAC